MCLRVYLNGDGTGRGTHLSLFFVVMKGPNDALLRWPFNQKVSALPGPQGGAGRGGGGAGAWLQAAGMHVPLSQRSGSSGSHGRPPGRAVSEGAPSWVGGVGARPAQSWAGAEPRAPASGRGWALAGLGAEVQGA